MQAVVSTHTPGKYRRQPEVGGNGVCYGVPTPHPVSINFGSASCLLAGKFAVNTHGLLETRYLTPRNQRAFQVLCCLPLVSALGYSVGA